MKGMIYLAKLAGLTATVITVFALFLLHERFSRYLKERIKTTL